MRIGLISDTHGLLRPEALSFMTDADHIVHAGDIGGAHVIEQLARIAPLTAIRGNNDTQDWADRLAETRLIELGPVRLYAIHDLAQLDIDPVRAGVQVVVSGHSHKPTLGTRDGVLYVNPGAAGPRRFRLPISVGELLIDGETITPRLHDLCPQ